MGLSPSKDLEKEREKQRKTSNDYIGFFFGWFTHPQVTDNISIDDVYSNLLSCGYLRKNGIHYPDSIGSILAKYLINLKYNLQFKHELVSFHTYDGIFIHNQSVNSLLQLQLQSQSQSNTYKNCQQMVKMFIQLTNVDCDDPCRLFRFGLIGIPKTDASYQYNDQIAKQYQTTFEKMINTTIQPKVIHKNTLLFSRIEQNDRKFTKNIIGHYIVTILQSSTSEKLMWNWNWNDTNDTNDQNDMNDISCSSYYCMFDDIGTSLCENVCVVVDKINRKNNKLDRKSVFEICIEKYNGDGGDDDHGRKRNMKWNLYFNQNGKIFCLNSNGKQKAMKIELDLDKYCYYFAISSKYCNCPSRKGILFDVII